MPLLRHLRFFLCLALFFALPLSAHALQLGETRAQLVARHGPPGDEDHARNLATYFWDGWSAQLEFHKGTVCRITYKRDWYLSEQEITSLLDSNGGSAHWMEITDPGEKIRIWAREDGAAASCTSVHPLNIVFEAVPDLGDAPALPKSAAPAASPSANASTQSPKAVASDEIPPDAEFLFTSPGPAAAAPTAPASHTTGEPQPGPTHPSASALPVAPNLIYALGGIVIFALASTVIYLLKRRPRPVEAGPVVTPRTTLPPPTPNRLPELRNSSPNELELAVAGLFRHEGYSVELPAAVSGHGLPLTLRRYAETALVQCIVGKYAPVSGNDVRDFHNALATDGVAHGILITTGEFTAEARHLAETYGLELLDGPALEKRLTGGDTPQPRETPATAAR